MKLLLLVCVGGAVGSGLRYGTDRALAHLWPQQAAAFPWATLTVNLVGCFIAGLLYGWLGRDGVRYADELKILLIVGLCGGLTTFSAFALQTVHLAPGRAFANVAASVAGGLLLAWGGAMLTTTSPAN